MGSTDVRSDGHPDGQESIADLLVALRADTHAAGGAQTANHSASATDGIVSPIRWEPPMLRRLAIGWGFDGASIRTLLANSTDSLTCLVVRVVIFPFYKGFHCENMQSFS